MCKITGLLHGYPKKHGLSIEWISSELWNQFDISVSRSALQGYLSPDNPTPFPAFLIVPFCKICNSDFSVLDFIEADAKRTAIAINCKGEKINSHTIARIAKEAGEAIYTLATAIEDGVITPEESKQCIKELLDVQQIITGLLVRLNMS